MKSPAVFGYARVSHKKQLDQHNNGGDEADSLDSQERRCKEYYQRHLAPLGIPYVQTFFDRAVSASKINFDRRPAAIQLMRTVNEGDHVIIDKVDRIYRRMKDFIGQTEWFKNHDVTVHFADFGSPKENATETAFFTMRATFAQLESSTTSERIKATNAHFRKMGTLSTPKNCPRVCKLVTIEGKRILIWDNVMRSLAGRIVYLHDCEGKNFPAIANIIQPTVDFPTNRYLVWGLYQDEKLIEKYGVTEPSCMHDALAKEKEERRKEKVAAERNLPRGYVKPQPKQRDKKWYLRKLGVV